MNMNTHIDMLVCRIENARTFEQLLRGVRRSRKIARKHGCHWRLVRDAAYGRVLRNRSRKAQAAVKGGQALPTQQGFGGQAA